MNYKVFTKATESSPWKFTGVIEASRETADKLWPDIIRRLRYHSYKLEYCTHGVTIDRSGE